MAEVVISELIDEAAVAAQAADYDVLYDRHLVDHPEKLVAALTLTGEGA